MKCNKMDTPEEEGDISPSSMLKGYEKNSQQKSLSNVASHGILATGVQSNEGIFNIKDESDHSSLFNNSLGFKYEF
jgi:hypothetical protein